MGWSNDSFFVRSYWRALSYTIRHSNPAAVMLTIALAFLLFFIFEVSSDHHEFLRVSRLSWLTVVGSLLASAVFLGFQSFMTLLKTPTADVYRECYAQFVDGNGLRSIMTQRGDEVAQAVYKNAIKTAQQRVWAIGMTNRHFIQQHADTLTKVVENRNIEIIIAFWNPRAIVEFDVRGVTTRLTAVDLQCRLEGAGGFSAQAVDRIQTDLEHRFRSIYKIKGTMKIIDVTHAAHFSCMVVDDDVYFFPFLAGPESTNDPAIHCSASTGIGLQLVQHFQHLFDEKDLCRTVFGR